MKSKAFFALLCLGFTLTVSKHLATESRAQGAQRQLPSQANVSNAGVAGTNANIAGVVAGNNGTYTIEDPRPLEQAAILLERKLGVPVWYEDPLWAFSGDLVQAADLQQNREVSTKNPGWLGPLVPRGGRFEITLPATAEALRASDPLTLLQTVVDRNTAFGNAGTFKVVKVLDSGYSIVGTAVADNTGRLKATAPPLDRSVSFPEMERTLADTLNLICEQVGVQLMVQFRGGPEQSRLVRIGANNEVARNVLARTMKFAGGTKASWVLDYMPDLKIYTLGLRAAQAEVPVSGTGAQLKTLFWPKP